MLLTDSSHHIYATDIIPEPLVREIGNWLQWGLDEKLRFDFGSLAARHILADPPRTDIIGKGTGQAGHESENCES